MVVREEVALLLAKDVPFHLRQHILEEDFHARPCDRVKVIDKVGPFERLQTERVVADEDRIEPAPRRASDRLAHNRSVRGQTSIPHVLAAARPRRRPRC